MKVYSRDQFTAIMGEKLSEGQMNDILWIPEQVVIGKPAAHFIQTRPILTDNDVYWPWCTQSLQGQVRCFASDGNEQEWWGFTDYDDIVIWTLKWIT